jgi:hypothetical protein
MNEYYMDKELYIKYENLKFEKRQLEEMYWFNLVTKREIESADAKKIEYKCAEFHTEVDKCKKNKILQMYRHDKNSLNSLLEKQKSALENIDLMLKILGATIFGNSE